MSVKNKYAQEEWDDYYDREKKIHIPIKKYGIFTSYDIYLFHQILRRYIPHDRERRIVEIGSGDGKIVKDIAKVIGGKAEGIEYSAPAARMAELSGVPTIVSDAFSEEMLNEYKESFDVVFSYGFVEHIIPPCKAIEIHLALLKKGGYFFIQIPRLRKFNWLRLKIFRPSLLAYHNLDLMEAEVLERECLIRGVKKIFCGAYGTFKVRVPMEQKNFCYYLLKIICLVENVTNPLFRLLFGDRGFETRLFSPAIIFIGQRI